MKSKDQEAVVIDITRDGFMAYSKWTQAGFPLPVPEDLKAFFTEQAYEIILSDARWHGGTGVRVHGDMTITEMRALSADDETATVLMVYNDDNVTFTVNGKPRNKLKNDTITVEVNLIHENTWKIDTITALEHNTPQQPTKTER